MWTREMLKENAKKGLKKYYLEAFLVSLLLAAAGGEVTFREEWRVAWNQTSATLPAIDWGMMGLLAMGAGTISTFSFLIRVLVGNPVEVGARRFFVQSRNRQRSVGFATVLEAFQSGRYGNIVITLLLRDVFVLLFCLLLIVPGIIKHYEYLMVPYLLSDDPTLEWKETLERSRQLMDGHKMEAFILELSFLGWYILGTLLLGIGVYFVNPYKDATMAEFYTALKETALD